MSTGNRYDKDFKEGAIKLVLEKGRSAAQVSKDLGINPQTLYRWLKEASDSQDEDLTRIKALEAEIKSLKKDKEDLEDTIEILKKAAAIFAKM